MKNIKVRSQEEVRAKSHAAWYHDTGFLSLCLLLAPCSAAPAQQAGKILRIGFLDPSTASGRRGSCGRVPARDEQLGGSRKEYRFRVPVCRTKA